MRDIVIDIVVALAFLVVTVLPLIAAALTTTAGTIP
jgi:hypothetical protein